MWLCIYTIGKYKVIKAYSNFLCRRLFFQLGNSLAITQRLHVLSKFRYSSYRLYWRYV